MTRLRRNGAFEIYLCPPLTVLMTEDIFDLSKNKMTIEERVSIAKNVIKKLGMTTCLRILCLMDANLSKGEIDRKLVESEIKMLEEGERRGTITLYEQDIVIEINDYWLSFKITLHPDKNKLPYEKVMETVNFPLCHRGNEYFSPLTMPQVADDYFECYFRGLLRYVILLRNTIEWECSNRNMVGDDLYRRAISKSDFIEHSDESTHNQCVDCENNGNYEKKGE